MYLMIKMISEKEKYICLPLIIIAANMYVFNQPFYYVLDAAQVQFLSKFRIFLLDHARHWPSG